jgi:tetratricopeptide (TPR) repeat protein
MKIHTREKVIATGIGAGVFLLVMTWAAAGILSGPPAGEFFLLLIGEILFTIAFIALFLREDGHDKALARPLAAGFLFAVLAIVIMLISGPAIDPPSLHPDIVPGNNGKQVIVMAVRTDEISTWSPEAKELLLQGLTTASRDNRFGEAIPYYDRALALDPDFTEAWMAKGVALFNLGNYHGASECMDRALLIDPDNDLAWSLKESILAATNRSGEAGRS